MEDMGGASDYSHMHHLDVRPARVDRNIHAQAVVAASSLYDSTISTIFPHAAPAWNCAVASRRSSSSSTSS